MALDKRDCLALSSVTIFALLLRVFFVFIMQSDPLVYDSKMYLMVADGIVNEAPISSFPNGYPIVIALFRSFLATAQTVQALLVLNVVLSTACIPLTYLLARAYRPERWIPLVVSFLMAVYPHQLRYAQLVMTETIATFFLLVAMLGVIWITKNIGRSTSIAIPLSLCTGLFFHMTGAIRPSLLLIGVIVPIAIWIVTKSIRIPVLLMIGFLIGAGLLFVIEKSPLARPPHAFANNLLISINSDSNGTAFVAYPEPEQKRAATTYVQFATKNPVRFLRQRAISIWELWGPKSLAGYRQEQETGVVKGVILLRTIFLLFFIIGVVRERRNPLTILLCVPVIVITLVHTLTFSNHRFLVPIEPYLFIPSMIGGMMLFTFIKRQTISNNRPVVAAPKAR